jgi:predicted phosphohydrolase
MTRLAWTTDIHLNFLSSAEIDTWLQSIHTSNKPDALLITGDISEGDKLADCLSRMVTQLDIPIYFVLGNHDYYRSSIDCVRANVKKVCAEHDKLHALAQSGVITLADDIALVGHGGWSDGGYGDFLNSPIVLNDYLLIQDLAVCALDLPKLLVEIQALGKEAGEHLRNVLPQAAKTHRQVYVALHSPPFPETAWHEGKTPALDDPHLPHFTCKAAGDALLEAAQAYPNVQFTVLCGHTHGAGERHILPNLHVITGGAEYCKPQIKRVFEL